MPLDRERWDRIQQVFHDVVDLPADERTASLELACQGDEDLKRAIAELLAQDKTGGSIIDRDVDAVADRLFSDSGAAATGTFAPSHPRTFAPSHPRTLAPSHPRTLAPSHPRTFGPYRVIQRLGEGGMGVVYLAEREDVGQRAAVKVLRDLWLSPESRVRFAGEQRTLARLNHPSIAKLYDADTLADGTPWFAMEYVEGISLTQYCWQHGCSTRERLRLFRDVCEAVQHAHQRLVVHRDLKPSNILVTSDGSIALLDFGIAKQLEALDTPANQTRTLSRLMTPSYAAPEQLTGGEAGIQSDIYSLGVILYELLTGRLPFDLTNITPRDAEALILERQPERPSIAARESSTGASASAAAWGDLDVLCLTAMHKDGQRRYRSVEALAAASVILVAAAALVGFYTVRLNRANATARAEAAREQRIQQFMLQLFNAGETDAAPSNDLRVVTLVDRGVQEARGLSGEPAIQAALYQTLGSLYQRLGRYDRADELLRLAWDARIRLGGREHPDALESEIALGLLQIDRAKLDEAERLEREALDISTRTRPAGDRLIAKATAALGKVLEERGAYDQAIPVLERAVKTYEAASPPPPEFAAALSQLANTHFYAGHMEASEALNKRALEIDRALHGPRHANIAESLLNLGAIASNREQYADAVRYYREALDIMQEWYGEPHPQTASAMTILAQGLVRLRQYDEASSLFKRALATQESVYGPVHRRVSFVLNELGMLALVKNDLDDAESALGRALEINRKLYQNTHFRVGNSLANLGSVYIAREQYGRAETILREAIAVDEATLPASHVNTAIARVKLGRALARARRYADAEGPLLEGYRSLKAQASPPASWIKTASEDLVSVYAAMGKPEQANAFK
jgi:serine/threonine-protein kinase